MDTAIKLDYDRGDNMAYISLKEIKEGEVAETRTFDDLPRSLGEINLDFDRNGTLIGIEIGMAQSVLPEDLLKAD